MYRVIDLTLTLTPGKCPYQDLMPDLPEVEIEAFFTVTKDGFSTDVLHFPTLAGTYLETSAHLFPGGPMLETIPPARFVTPASVIQLPNQPPAGLVTADLLAAYAPEIDDGEAILIASGWESHAGADDYVLASPRLTRDAAEWLMSHHPHLVGGDMTTNDDPDHPQGVNQAIFGQGALLLAPLVNLRSIKSARLTLFALPMKVAGVCGAPCRALAMDHQH